MAFFFFTRLLLTRRYHHGEFFFCGVLFFEQRVISELDENIGKRFFISTHIFLYTYTQCIPY